MAGDDNVLRSFLFGLDWKNNTSQQKEVVGAIESATLKANLLADAIVGMASKIGVGIQSVSDDFLKLSVLADQTKTSATSILALQQGFLQFAGSASDANQLVQTISNSLRSMNDGNISYYRKFGISQNAVTKQITIDLAEGQKNLSGLSDAAVTQYANLAGIPVQTAELIQHHGAEMQRAIDDQKERMKAFGVNDDTVQQGARYAKAYLQVMADFDAAWQKIAEKIEAPLTPALEKFDKWAQANGPALTQTITDIGAAVEDDLVKPFQALGEPLERVLDEASGAKNALGGARSMVDDLKSVLESVKSVIDTVRSGLDVLNSVQKWGEDHSLPKMLGIRPDWWNAGQGGRGTIDFSAPTVPLWKKLEQDPGADARRRLNEQLNPGSVTPQAPAATAPEGYKWWKPWNWGRGSSYENSEQSRIEGLINQQNAPTHLDPNLLRQSPNLPSPDATPDALEVGTKNNGFAIPGSGQEASDSPVALSVGGSPVQSGNPLPVKIDKIEPGAGGVGGLGGDGGGDRRSGRGGLADYAKGNRGGDAASFGANGGSAAPKNTADAMRVAMDQLRKEGVPDSHLRAAAAELVGQATMESGLDPTKVHDGGTGYGIYGARLNRLDAMFDWMGKSGFTKNSLEGQMRYMAHEAMTKFPQTRQVLMGATGDNILGQTGAVTANFESPEIVNDRRSAVAKAFQSAASAEPAPATAAAKPAERAPRANIHIPNVYGASGQSSEYPTPGEKSYTAAPIVHRPYTATPLEHQSYQYDNSDNSVTHHHNYNTSVAVNGVSDPQEAASAVGSTLDQVFSKAQTKTRMLQGAIA